jgi:hypothetical protein
LEFNRIGHKKLGDYLKVVNTGTLDKYNFKWGSREMVYLKDKYSGPVVRREEFRKTFNDTYYRRSVSPKLIIKGLTLLDAALDLRGEIIPGKSTLVITSSDVGVLKFLCGVLNSKLASLYIREKYSASSYNGGVVFSKDMLNGFPLPDPDASTRKRVVGLVDKILAARSDDPTADVDRWQKEIDAAVYEMYELKESDIHRVESASTRRKSPVVH